MIRVLIQASSAALQTNLEALFRGSEGFEVVPRPGGAATREAALAEAEVVVAETDTPDGESLGKLLEWAEEGGAVVLLSDAPPVEWSRDLLRAGVRAILPGGASDAEIVAAAEAAAAGLVAIHPGDVDRLLAARATAPGVAPPALIEPLTPREIEVLQQLAEGIGNKEIATRMGISDHTVKFHIASILGKLGATSRTEAVTLGIRHGLILI
jgi:DNA-binding NarL/FixJ family response regulator